MLSNNDVKQDVVAPPSPHIDMQASSSSTVKASSFNMTLLTAASVPQDYTSLSKVLSAKEASESTDLTATATSMNANNKRVISLTASWGGKKIPFEVDLDYTIGDLKNKLMELTNVQPKRQKLMLVKGRLPDDDVVLSTLSLKENQTFLMMGTPEAHVLKKPEVMPDVYNDLEEDYIPDDETFANHSLNQKNLMKTIEKCEINLMHPLRPGKKLLVLDLDYTLIDCKLLGIHPTYEVIRPGLHEFMTICYEYYDIVIWSQTSWRALEAKVTTLGLLTHSDYKVSFVMDITSMFSVTSQRDGKPFKHQVKALDIIWNKFPTYSAMNTIHVDDLSRNFAMNPKSGLKISAFKNGPVSRQTDRELLHLAQYLVSIAVKEDFRQLDHKYWRKHRRQ